MESKNNLHMNIPDAIMFVFSWHHQNTVCEHTIENSLRICAGPFTSELPGNKCNSWLLIVIVIIWFNVYGCKTQ